jgi:hypothetical protein
VIGLGEAAFDARLHVIEGDSVDPVAHSAFKPGEQKQLRR